MLSKYFLLIRAFLAYLRLTSLIIFFLDYVFFQPLGGFCLVNFGSVSREQPYPRVDIHSLSNSMFVENVNRSFNTSFGHQAWPSTQWRLA